MTTRRARTPRDRSERISAVEGAPTPRTCF
jgi:hypothetical protein